jgi:predicted adenine nucleotide alpha hydrolase (AANH) superfamily ATPase
LKVLVHACCGPCAIPAVLALRGEGLEPTLLYYNPNIHPLAEYLRRREALAEVARRLDVPVIWKDDEYDPKVWMRAVAFREARRCFHCCHLRLERAASIARRGRFEAFTTTLLSSKRQKHEEVAQIGADVAGGGRCAFLYRDFRAGSKEGFRLTLKWGIYRQDYCGCLLSEAERHAKKLKEPPISG